MNSIPFDEAKAISAILYIINKTGGNIDMYKLAKTLYFADQKHLIQYGRTILGDEYVPMDFGPVPSIIYDAIKEINTSNPKYKLFSEKLEMHAKQGYREVSSNQKPDMDELSVSDIECLDNSIEENNSLSFNDLYKKSHGSAWTNAAEKGFKRILVEDIAKEAGADDKFITYVKEYINDCYLELN
jgi:uncharacterized phage-associated protein